MSDQDATSKRAEQVAALEEAVRDVLASDGFRRWADARKAFRDYSFSNQLLIAVQRPEARRVAGYRSWQKLGRQVCKGEHAIRIWAPRTRTVEDEDTGERRRQVVGFVLVPVFDVSQTDGDELPEFPGDELTSADYPDALARLEGFAESMGFPVEYRDLGGPSGLCDLGEKRIAIESRLSTDARLKTLAHEVAHAHGIGYQEYGRERAEVVVEAAATLACDSLGLDSRDYSLPYIATYADGEEGLRTLRTDLAEIDRIASAIETAIAPRG